MILTLITVGKMLEARSKGKTTDALKSLMKLSPKTANIIRDDIEQTVPMLSPVRADSFTALLPLIMIPSTGMLSPGLTTKISPL